MNYQYIGWISHSPPNHYSSMFMNTPLGDLVNLKRIQGCAPPRTDCAHAMTPQKKGPQALGY